MNIYTKDKIDIDTAKLYYDSYFKQMNYNTAIILKPFSEFFSFMNKMAEGAKIIEIKKEITLASLMYKKTSEEVDHITIPVFAYYYKDIKYFSYVFAELLRKEISKTTIIEFEGYANDEQLFKYLSMTKFCITMETGIRKLSYVYKPSKNYKIVKLEKEEIENNFDKIWELISKIFDHLADSPIFYKNDEYTKAEYKELYMHRNTDVFVAKKDDEYIGLIESNDEKEGFLLFNDGYNISDIIVLKEYRKTGLAESLLAAVEYELTNKRDIKYGWVNHGTANPNACAFWDRYFKPYKYCFERKIEVEK